MFEYFNMGDKVEKICVVFKDVIEIGDCIICDFGGEVGIIEFI